MALITVLTPAYNRERELERLFHSLENQDNSDFEWLIVDDGSSDRTESKVKEWMECSRISILYIKKQNGGKHTALNAGIHRIRSKWTFVVDSDDYLTEEAISTIVKKDEKFDRPDICGFAFLRQSQNGSYLTNKLVPQDGLVESFCECRYGRKIVGDMAEVWKTECLKEYPFPEFFDEKFISEDVVWVAMAQKYKMVFFNKAIYISDYLEDGLTLNRRKHNMLSPRGCMYRGEVHLDADLPVKYKCRAMFYYSVYGFFAGYRKKELLKRSKHKVLFLMLWPVSRLVIYKWRK